MGAYPLRGHLVCYCRTRVHCTRFAAYPVFSLITSCLPLFIVLDCRPAWHMLMNCVLAHSACILGPRHQPTCLPPCPSNPTHHAVAPKLHPSRDSRKTSARVPQDHIHNAFPFSAHEDVLHSISGFVFVFVACCTHICLTGTVRFAHLSREHSAFLAAPNWPIRSWRVIR